MPLIECTLTPQALYLEYLYLTFQGQVHPQPLSTLQKHQSQDHRTEPGEITLDMVQPVLNMYVEKEMLEMF